MTRICPTCGQSWYLLSGPDMRRLREAAGLTLREMAKASKLDFTYLSKVETEGDGFPPTARTDKAYRKIIPLARLSSLIRGSGPGERQP